MRIEPLASRRTRLKLLLSSYLDACEAVGDGVRGDAASSRIPGRNLELWSAGSYKALERCMDEMRSSHRAVYRSTWLKYVLKTKAHSERAAMGLALLDRAMPRSIFVPAVISENAGYNAAEAKQFSRRMRD